MPNRFFRAASPAPRLKRAARKAPSPPAARPMMVEGLEERRLFALAITPLPAGADAAALGNQILVPNTGLTITGGTYTGAADQGGTYTGFDIRSLTNHLVIQDGILLTTGLAADALGPNLNSQQSTSHGTAGDPDLTTLMAQPTFDANALTLQFTAAPGTSSVLFDFIFGTEEFRELRGNLVVDAFAVYVDGTQVVLDAGTPAVPPFPGAPPRPMTVNNDFVTVDNSFIGAADNLNIEYDGLTPRLRTRAPLNTSLATHTIKFVIADTGAADFDSGAFITRLQGSAVLIGPTQASTGEPTPGIVQFSAAEYSVAENGGLATILVQRVGATQGAVSVDFAVTDGTAVNGQDYTATTGTVVLADQQTSAVFTVPILDDTIAEGNETVVLTLTNAIDAALGQPATATLTIVENEQGMRFGDPTPLSPGVVYSVVENIGSAQITVERFGDVTQPATVNYTTTVAGSTATAGQDYATTSGTLSFGANEVTRTFTIPVRADFEDEGTETVVLTLSGASAGTQLGQDATATLEIIDLDRPPSLYDITAFAPRNRIEALFLKFNTDMNVERVQDLANYSVYLYNEGRAVGRKRKGVKLQAPVYDVASKTLTLRPAVAIRQNVFYEVVVRTRTTNGVRSTTNQMLDGNLNGQLDLPQFGGLFFAGPFGTTITGDLATSPGEDFVGFFGRGSRLNYVDQNGDRVRIGVDGGGVIEVLRDARGEAQQVRVVAAPATAVLWGKVTPRRGSDASTTIDDLLLGGVQNRLAPPQFVVGWVL